jgi:hypothetical protein
MPGQKYVKVTTPEFRVSYPNVFQAKKNDLSGQDEFSVQALFPLGADMSKLKAACLLAAEEKWGSDRAKWPKALRMPFRDQGEREKDGVLPSGYAKGAVFVNLKNKNRPGLVDRLVQPIIEQSDFYGGCYAIASVTAFAYDQKGNRGVSLSLQNLQKTRDGEPFSGRSKAEEDFAPLPMDEQGGVGTSDDIFGV